MGRPINKKHFGPGAGKYAIKFYDGSSVVTGTIVKQVGSKKFKVQKSDGTGAKICTLAQDANQLALLISGTAHAGFSRANLCTIEATPFGGGVENVKSISTFRLVTIQGTKIKHKLGQAATTGFAVPAPVAQIALAVGSVIPPQVGTVAAAFSYQIPAAAFTGGNVPLTYSIAAVAGFAISSTGLLTKAAGASSVGAKNITVTVTDADGTTATAAAFTVTLS